jgi:hypothetical protein
MLQRQLKGPDRLRQSELSLLDHLLGDSHPKQFAVRFRDGTTWGPEPGQPARFTLVLCHPDSLKGMFRPPGGTHPGGGILVKPADSISGLLRPGPIFTADGIESYDLVSDSAGFAV